MANLPDAFIRKMIDRLGGEDTQGVVLVGSFARGEDGRYSDVDLWQFVRQEPSELGDPVPVEYIDGYLVTVKRTTLEKEYACLAAPSKALWTIPALRQALVLLDKDGAILALQRAAQSANWERLQKDADAFAAAMLAGACEEVHKLLDALARADESKIAYALWNVTWNLSEAVLVQRGMLVPSENVYIDYAQQAAGRESAWTCQFRLAVGLDPLPPGEAIPSGRGAAGLRLYCETAILFQDILPAADAAVVRRAIQMIMEAGY